MKNRFDPCGLIMLVAVRGLPFQAALPGVVAGAVLGTVTELASPSKYDTVTVPAVIVATLLALVRV